MNSKHCTIIAIAALAGLAALGISQAPKAPQPAGKSDGNPGHGTLNFKTSVGSFKILGGASPAEGSVELKFSGSVLVSGLDGTVTTSESVRKEIDNRVDKKQVFFGNGTMKVTGKFRAIQFFGRDLEGRFNGFGVMRLYGEFDKNLNTGEVWYEGKEHEAWGTSGKQMSNPPANAGANFDDVKVRDLTKPGAKPGAKP
jgi:hypothetical protein